MTLKKKTKEAASALANTLEYISKERIQTELVKLITSDNPGKLLDMYQNGNQQSNTSGT